MMTLSRTASLSFIVQQRSQAELVYHTIYVRFFLYVKNFVQGKFLQKSEVTIIYQ